MSYGIPHRVRAAYRLDVPAAAGFALSSLGAWLLVVGLRTHGWWGFVTSGWNFPFVFGWLIASAFLSLWALERADGAWKVLAGAGVAISAVGLLVMIVVALLRLLGEHPDLFGSDSKRRRQPNRRKQTHRRHYR